mgnify:CR=1 FL=1
MKAARKSRKDRVIRFLWLAEVVVLFAAVMAAAWLRFHTEPEYQIRFLEQTPWRALLVALAITGAQFERAIGLFRGTIRNIGHIACGVLQALKCLGRLFEQFRFPRQQFATEIFELTIIHERFVFGRTILCGKNNFSFHNFFLIRNRLHAKQERQSLAASAHAIAQPLEDVTREFVIF